MSLIMPQRNRKKRTLLRVLAVLIACAVIVAGGAFVWYKFNLKAPCDADVCPAVEFAISEGSGSKQIAENLADKGVIRSALAFRVYLVFEANDANLKAGNYELPTNLSVKEVVERLNKGAAAKTFRVTFLPGGTLAAARERLQNLGYSDTEITEAFNASYDHKLLASKPAGASLEGYIYGETYEFYAGASVKDILTRAFDEMYAQIQANDVEAKLSEHGLTLHEGVVLASVVQREAGSLTGDMPKVAQIFYNRLHGGIPLGSDAIIAYHADQVNPDRDKSDMSYLTTTECPWNSRRCQGLPPSAISTPGLSALQAVAGPDAEYEGYYYFLTGDDQQMYYARTEAEHEANKVHCPQLCGIL